MSQLLTVNDAAARLALHPKTVRRLIARGELRAVRIGRAVRVDAAELHSFVAGHKQEASWQTVPVQRITPAQLRALHAKADRADRITEQPRLTTKKRVLTEATDHFGQEIVSANDLDELQAIWVLERIDEIAELALA